MCNGRDELPLIRLFLREANRGACLACEAVMSTDDAGYVLSPCVLLCLKRRRHGIGRR
jgi:hypothetical protein